MEHMPVPLRQDRTLRVDSIHMEEHLLSRQDGLSGLDVEPLNLEEQAQPKRAVPCNS